MIKDAHLSEDGTYRYWLFRMWNNSYPILGFVMLNPSTADALEDDPTIRRCIGYARALGFGSLEVVNLYAYRSTDPDHLKRVAAPVGPDNDAWIVQIAEKADVCIAAWGAKASHQRQWEVKKLFADADRILWCLDINANGSPKHPLYLRKDLVPRPYTARGLRLDCPVCGVQHIDEGHWRGRRHRKHLCAACGHIWMPFEDHTVGVLKEEPC